MAKGSSIIALAISLSVIVFLFSSLAMYATWIVSERALGAFWSGITALFVWISTFGAGAIVFWRFVERISVSKVLSTRERSVAA